MAIKPLLNRLFSPLARVQNAVAPKWGQFWSYARLSAALGVRVDASVVLLGPVELHGTRRIALGERLYVYPGQYWETRENGRIEIGDDAVLSRGVHLVAYDSVRIGAGTMIGEYASVRDANHRRADPGTAPEAASGRLRDSGHEARAIVIGCGVWIGRGAVVLAGVTIGDGAVVGANAVVTRDVPAGAVVGGVPAQPLRSRSPSADTVGNG